MAIVDQIKYSNLSKQGKTNPSGIFEAVPQNVAAAVRGYTVPQKSAEVPPIQQPIDITRNLLPQPTYLDYLKSNNEL